MKKLIAEFKALTTFQRLLVTLLMVLNVLYLVYYAYWSFHTCAHYDDLRYLRDMGQMSMWEYLSHEYLEASGRYVWLALYGVLFKMSLWIGTIRVWPILFLLLGYGFTWAAVRDYKCSFGKLGLFSLVIFVYNLYVHTAIDYAVFVWICAMLYYLLAPCLLLYMKYLSQDELSKGQWVVWVLLTLLLGGGQEAFTPVVLVMMFCYGMYLWGSCAWLIKDAWQKPQTRRVVYSAIALLVLYAIVIVAPGNYARIETSTAEGFDHPAGLIGWVKAIATCWGTYAYFMVFYVPYYLVPMAICAYMGTKDQRNVYGLWKEVGVVTALFAVYALACVLPIAFVYNGFGIQRLYTYLVFGNLVYVCAIGYVIGSHLVKWQKFVAVISAVGVAAMCVVVACNICIDFPVMKRYADAVDQRRSYLCELNDKGQTELVVVEEYPNMEVSDVKYWVLSKLGKNTSKPSLYYRADTGKKPTEYERYYRQLFNLNFDFVLPFE